MNKLTITLVCLSFLLCRCDDASAKVRVNTGGSSIGAPCVSSGGPKGINKTARSRSKCGSIRTASARSKFTKKRVVHGNKVVSKGTAGDPMLTHVDANSIFSGTATFKSDDGEPVDDFIIDLGLKGILKCKTPDPEIPENFSLAQMSVDVVVDGKPFLAGTATQDGAGPFSTSGDISTEDFKTSPNKAKIRKKKPINLGTLTDGQKLKFFFAGSTLVSYGQEVPISFCAADFFNTDTFQAAKKQDGTITISEGRSVDVGFDSDSESLYIESEDDTLLGEIDGATVIVALGGGTFSASPAADIDDIDKDGISDLVITADSEADQKAMIGAIQTASNNTVFVFATTPTDTASGVLDTASL